MKPAVFFLCGFMGVGKSTIGQQAAKKLGWNFLDTDQWIVKTAGRAIVDIFKNDGEKRFREYEQEALQKMPMGPSMIVSLGGGLLVQPANLQEVKKRGYLIYLSAKPETILERVSANADERPLLANLSDHERKAKIENLMSERQAQYGQADLEIITDGRPEVDVVNEVVAKIQGILK